MKNLGKNELQFFQQLREIIDNEPFFEDLLKIFNLYVEGIVGADELFVLAKPIFDHIEDEDTF